MRALDDATRSLQLFGKGADRGGSSASMDLAARIEPGETFSTSVLVGHAAVIVNGKFAQFGGRMLVQVSDMLLARFADNFRAAAAALPGEASAPRAVPGDAAPSAVAPADADPTAAAAAGAAASGPAGAPAAAPAAAPANEINALAIVWGLIKSWVAGLFGKRA